MKKGIIVIMLVVLVATALAGYRSLAAGTTYSTANVKRGDIAAIVSAIGKVAPENEARLGFKMGGRVDKILVKAGEAVQQSQVLAEMNAVTLENNVLQARASFELAELKVAQAQAGARPEEIKAAEANLEGAKAKLDDLRRRPTALDLLPIKAALDKAAVGVQDAQNAYDKVSWKEGSPEFQATGRGLQLATIEYEAAKARYEDMAKGPSAEELRVAESQVMAAEAQLDLRRQGVSSEDIAILRKQVELAKLAYQQALDQRSEALLLSPISGTVLAVQVTAGENVQPQQWVASVGDVRALEVRASIDEVDVGKIAEGQEVTVVFDAFPGQKVAGRIDRIAPSATVQQGSTIYQTTVKFSAPELQVRPGMAASLDVIAKRKEGTLLVPNRAIQTVGKKKYVEVVENGERARVEVETGLYNERETEIVTGLQEGQTIVVW